MKVGFFYEELSSKARPHLEIAKHLLASVRETMPGVEVWQLTDGESPVLEGIDGVSRERGDMPMGVRRVSLYAANKGDWLFVDTDVVIKKDVRDVFDSDFDVALTDRVGTDMEGTPYAREMPYNFGVIFSRSPAFWLHAKVNLQSLTMKYQHWEGEQRVIAGIGKNSKGYKIKILPGRIYNFPPLSKDDTDASILHYKGARKKFLMEAA